MGKALKRQAPLSLPDLTKEEIVALKSVYQGTAREDQQKLALSVIMKKFCMIGGLEFDVDPHIAAFNGGKRLVGLQILDIINTPIEKLVKGA